MHIERRASERDSASGRRRFPRYEVELDWVFESEMACAMGRDAEVSLRSFGFAASFKIVQPVEGLLSISLPGRTMMLKAKGVASPTESGMVVMQLFEMSESDWAAWGKFLVATYGAKAIPMLRQKMGTMADLLKEDHSGTESGEELI